MIYSKAKPLADRVVEMLQPHCNIINIAGSVRREKPEVKDIEVVAVPKKIFNATDLFGGGNNIIVPGFAEAIEQFTKSVIKGKPDGKYMQIELKGGMVLDLFMPSPEDYYRIFAIRTGSADYSANVIANAWVRLGWCGVSGVGLRKQEDCTRHKDKWILSNPNGEKPPAWTSEENFFEWLQIRWLHPRNRETTFINLAQ